MSTTLATGITSLLTVACSSPRFMPGVVGVGSAAELVLEADIATLRMRQSPSVCCNSTCLVASVRRTTPLVITMAAVSETVTARGMPRFIAAEVAVSETYLTRCLVTTTGNTAAAV